MITYDRAQNGPVTMSREGILEGRIVPWNTDAEVVDRRPNGTEDHYIEAFARGAFDPQTTSSNIGTIRKIEFVEQHSEGLGKIGYALHFEDREDGQWGAFRILSRHLDDVAQMVDDGINGLSIRFHEKAGGVRTSRVGRLERRLRTAAHLIHVALVPEPAYPAALVGSLRDQDPEVLAEQAAIARSVEADELLAGIEASSTRWAHLGTVDT